VAFLSKDQIAKIDGGDNLFHQSRRLMKLKKKGARKHKKRNIYMYARLFILRLV